MKVRNRFISYSVLFILVLPSALLSWEDYDKVIAVINDEPVVKSQIEERFELIKRQKKISPRKVTYEKSRLLDAFIEEALVKETANDESIVINDTRVITHIEKMMKQYLMQKIKDPGKAESLASKMAKALSNRMEEKKQPKNEKVDKALDDFIAFIEKNNKIPFDDYFQEVRRQMMREQVMSIAIGITPPTEEEAMTWYNANKKDLGFEFNVKHILIKSHGSSLKNERKANNMLSSIRKKIVNGKKSFEEMAKTFSQDTASAKNGGSLGWVWQAELDPFFANHIYLKMRRRGQISQVFKSNFGYHIVKYLGRRRVTYDKVKRMIMFKLYNEKMEEQFDNWVIQRKKMSDIKIYMKDYIKNKKS